MTHLNLIEEAIAGAFIFSIGDYKKKYIFNEEDFRVAFYHHLRRKTKKYSDLKIHLSFTFEGKYGVAKPDIVIFRKSEPLVVMEFKIAPYTKSSGEKDIERLKYWSSDFSKGYFVHIDKSERKYSQRITNWKNHYYKELAYYTHNEKGCLFEVKHGKKYLGNII